MLPMSCLSTPTTRQAGVLLRSARDRPPFPPPQGGGARRRDDRVRKAPDEDACAGHICRSNVGATVMFGQPVSLERDTAIVSTSPALSHPRIFRGWLVVAAAFAVTFVGFGSAYTFSAFV